MADAAVSQTRLAEGLGMSQSSVSRRLTGEAPFDVNELGAIADILGVTVADLLSPLAAEEVSA